MTPASTSAAARRTHATISSVRPSASWRGHLRVADAHLDGAERVVRAHRPPELGELDDRARAHQHVHVVRPRPPGAERVRDPTARERLGERLRAAGVQAGVAPVDVRRVRADRQQQRQDRAQPVADPDRPVGAADADVDVDREGVVAPGHVLQPVLDPVVVLGVDDVLLAVVAERVRAGCAEGDAVVASEREEAAAGVGLAHAGVVHVRPGARADLDLGRDELAGDRLRQHRVARRGVAQQLEARREQQRLRIHEGELLLDADGEVGGGLERLARCGEVDHGTRQVR